jgi:hypothetical protein
MSGCASKLRACKKKHYLPQAGEPPIPLPRWLGGTSTVPTGTSAVPAGTSTNDPATGSFAPTSRVDSTATPSARGDGGAGSQQSEVVLSPSLSSSSEDEFANTNAGGGGTLLHAQPVLIVVLINVLLPHDPPLLHEGRPVPLLLHGATGDLRSRHQQVRSGGMDGHQL